MVPSHNGQLCSDFKILEALDTLKSDTPQKMLSKQTQTQGTQEHTEHMISDHMRMRSELQPASLVFQQSFLVGGAESYTQRWTGL